MTLKHTVERYVETLKASKRPKLPDQAQIAGNIGKLLGLDYTERQRRRPEFVAAFMQEWKRTSLVLEAHPLL